jgi:hypothetical protein
MTIESKHERALQKLTLVKSLIGDDLDTAMNVLAYAMAEVAMANDVTFHSVIKNMSLIWEHLENLDADN